MREKKVGKKGKRARERGASSIPGFPELLAPAGNVETFFAAVDSGADAVYLGLGDFNARKRGENFSLPDLGKLIPYAHSRGIKVYVTFNTQVLEGELPRFIDTVSRTLLFQPDALILSDLGAVRIVRKYFPRVEMHASTMMGNFNSRIASVLAEMGVKRLVAERHLTFEQLRDLIRRSPIGIEVFVHGAMCFSFSGKCLFSSYLGGKSGNRGECVQPCRRVYLEEEKGSEKTFFSAKDLSLVEMLPDLIRLGVAGFKIEGRLRNAEYVKDVVSAYRRCLDRIKAGQAEQGIEEAKELLGKVIGRESTGGVLFGASGESVASSEEGSAVGEYLGKVGEVKLPFVRLDREFSVKKGERLRVQDRDTGKGTGFTLNVVEKRGGDVWMKIPFPVKEGDLVFRVSASSRRKDETGRALERFSPLPTGGHVFDVLLEGTHIQVEGRLGKYRESFRFRVSGAPSGLSLDGGEVEKILSVSYRGDMPLSKVRVRMKGDVAVTLEEVVAAFDDASRKFDKNVHLDLKSLRVSVMNHLRLRGKRVTSRPVTFYCAVDAPEVAKELLEKVEFVIVSVSKNLARNPGKLGSLPRDRIMLGLPFAKSDQELTFYRKSLERFSRMGFSSYLLPDLGWLKVFRELKVKVKTLISDHYLYVFNTASAITLEELGFSRFVLPLESTLENVRKMGRYMRGLGVFPLFARVPLMKSRLITFPGEGEKRVVSRFGERFGVIHSHEGTEVYPEGFFCAAEFVDDLMGVSISEFFIDVRGVPVDEVRTIVDNILKGKAMEGASTFNMVRRNF